MTSPEFHLPPWEHGRQHIAPSIELSARVAGQRRPFRVKVRGEHAYFRFADRTDHRIWAIPLANPLDWKSTFVQAVESDQVARYFVVRRSFSGEKVAASHHAEVAARFSPSNQAAIDHTTLAVMVYDDGHGYAQEWYGGPWFAFVLPPRPHKSLAHRPDIWYPGWNVSGMKRALDSITTALAFRPFTPPPTQSLHFLGGSRQRLETLFRVACVQFLPEFERTYAPRNGIFGSYRLPLNQIAVWHFQLFITSESGRRDVEFRQGSEPLLPDWLQDLLLAHHWPVGGEWSAVKHYHHGIKSSDAAKLSPTLRCDFAFHEHDLRIEVQIPRPITSHERLEAFRTLRSWLESIREEQHIPELLA